MDVYFFYESNDDSNNYLLMALTKSAAEGCRMRSRKYCHVGVAVDDPKASEFSIILRRQSNQLMRFVKLGVMPKTAD